MTAGNSGRNVWYQLSAIEYIHRPGGTPIGLRIRKTCWIHQHQSLQSHGLHCPSRTTDVAWVTWLDQHDAQALKKTVQFTHFLTVFIDRLRFV
jgi:hypothetical protein